MKLTSSNPYWFLRHGIGAVPQPLSRNRACDVVVIGAGISGALVADKMARAGLKVIVVDKRYPCHGSTAGSTALLQYEIDASLTELTRRVGKADAVAAYRACAHAILEMKKLARDLGEDVAFRTRPSLYLASKKSDVSELREERRQRLRAGLPCEFWDARRLSRDVDFAAPGALWTPLAAEVDPWALAGALFKRNKQNGVELYGRTEVKAIAADRDGVRVLAGRFVVRARHAVVACGYESEQFLPRRPCRLISTYALITEPVPRLQGWPERALIWETARPYGYWRTTLDNRILLGGEDLPFRNPVHRDARLPARSRRLLKRARTMFPRLDLQMAYAWAGTFGETRDGLPLVGAYPGGSSRILFCLGFGGNGIVFSMVAADVLTAAVMNQAHRLGRLFSFDRPGA